MKLLFLFAGMLASCVAATPGFAADIAGPTTVTMTVHPQATTRPALAIRFVPDLLDAAPGDAAPVYLIASILWTRETNTSGKPATDDTVKAMGLDPQKDRWTTSSMLMEAPLAKLKSEEAERYVAEQQPVLALLESASRRETCRWDTSIREQGYATLLPHLQALRDMSASVCIKARTQLAAGDARGALHTLRLNFILARNLNQQAVLIQSLVAASICNRSLVTLREIEQTSGSPNIFWPLAELPRPMIDATSAMESERAAIYYSIPSLRRVRTGNFTDADWQATMEKLSLILGVEHPGDPLLKQLQAVGMSAMLFAQARQYLINKGMTAEQVDALPKTMVLGRYYVESLDDMYDDITKWSKLPYWQARPGMLKLEEELKAKRSNPLMGIVPAVNRAVFTLRRLDRDIAAMQIVEAVRDYAARHNGDLPKKLEALTETPPPIDPIWGKPFDYQVEGRQFTLTSAAPPEGRPAEGLVVKVTVEK